MPRAYATFAQKTMTSYEKVRKNPRQFNALTSISVELFDLLLPIFESYWQTFIKKYNFDGTPRFRKYAPKMRDNCPAKLISYFFLFYKKTNSLQELMTFEFD